MNDKEHLSETRVCDLCNGKGSVSMTIHDWILDEQRTEVSTCIRCKGKGFLRDGTKPPEVQE